MDPQTLKEMQTYVMTGDFNGLMRYSAEDRAQFTKAVLIPQIQPDGTRYGTPEMGARFKKLERIGDRFADRSDPDTVYNVKLGWHEAVNTPVVEEIAKLARHPQLRSEPEFSDLVHVPGYLRHRFVTTASKDRHHTDYTIAMELEDEPQHIEAAKILLGLPYERLPESRIPERVSIEKAYRLAGLPHSPVKIGKVSLEDQVAQLLPTDESGREIERDFRFFWATPQKVGNRDYGVAQVSAKKPEWYIAKQIRALIANAEDLAPSIFDLCLQHDNYIGHLRMFKEHAPNQLNALPEAFRLSDLVFKGIPESQLSGGPDKVKLRMLDARMNAYAEARILRDPEKVEDFYEDWCKISEALHGNIDEPLTRLRGYSEGRMNQVIQAIKGRYEQATGKKANDRGIITDGMDFQNPHQSAPESQQRALGMDDGLQRTQGGIIIPGMPNIDPRKLRGE